MRRLMLLVAVLLPIAAFLAGCNRQSQPQQNASKTEGQAVEQTEIATGTKSLTLAIEGMT